MVITRQIGQIRRRCIMIVILRGGECGVVTNLLYRQPTVLESTETTQGAWWSYDVGIIHFVGMSTEHNFSIGSKQWQWLKENVDISVTPWVVFGGHRPMYINSDYLLLWL